jgi:hypothetical protein
MMEGHVNAMKCPDNVWRAMSNACFSNTISGNACANRNTKLCQRIVYCGLCLCMSSYSLPLVINSNTCYFYRDELHDSTPGTMHPLTSTFARAWVLAWNHLIS